MGRLEETWRRSLADPAGLLGGSRRGRELAAPLGPRARRLARAVLPLVRGRRAQHLPQRASTATSSAGRGEQAALIYDSPRHRTRSARSPIASCSDEVARFAGALRGLGVAARRPRADLHADGARGRDRHARLRAPRRDPLGGVRRLRAARARRRASTTRSPRVVLTASCGIEPGRVVPYKPLLDAGDRARAARSPSTAWCCSGRSSRAALDAGRDLDWDERRGARRARRVRAGGRDRSALHPLHVRHDRHARRASCATTAATRSRSHWSMRNVYGMQPGEVFWAASDIGWVGRPLVHRVRAAAATAARRCSTRASRSARPTRARSGA